MDLFDEGGDSVRGLNSLKRPRLTGAGGGPGSISSLTNNGPNNGSVESLHLMSALSSPGGVGGPGAGGVGASGLGPVSKKGVSRARSDSAPLGYGHHHHHGSMSHLGTSSWGVHGGLGAMGGGGGVGGRPRSGSGMVGSVRIPNIGSLTRGAGATPLLSISAAVPQ